MPSPLQLDTCVGHGGGLLGGQRGDEFLLSGVGNFFSQTGRFLIHCCIIVASSRQFRYEVRKKDRRRRAQGRRKFWCVGIAGTIVIIISRNMYSRCRII